MGHDIVFFIQVIFRRTREAGKNEFPARAARKVGSRGEFRAARAVGFRQGAARSGFALFSKLSIASKNPSVEGFFDLCYFIF